MTESDSWACVWWRCPVSRWCAAPSLVCRRYSTAFCTNRTCCWPSRRSTVSARALRRRRLKTIRTSEMVDDAIPSDQQTLPRRRQCRRWRRRRRSPSAAMSAARPRAAGRLTVRGSQWARPEGPPTTSFRCTATLHPPPETRVAESPAPHPRCHLDGRAVAKPRGSLRSPPAKQLCLHAMRGGRHMGVAKRALQQLGIHRWADQLGQRRVVGARPRVVDARSVVSTRRVVLQATDSLTTVPRKMPMVFARRHACATERRAKLSGQWVACVLKHFPECPSGRKGAARCSCRMIWSVVRS